MERWTLLLDSNARALAIERIMGQSISAGEFSVLHARLEAMQCVFLFGCARRSAQPGCIARGADGSSCFWPRFFFGARVDLAILGRDDAKGFPLFTTIWQVPEYPYVIFAALHCRDQGYTRQTLQQQGTLSQYVNVARI